MTQADLNRRTMLGGAAAAFAGVSLVSTQAAAAGAAQAGSDPSTPTQITFTKTEPPAWLMAFWREIDNKTWGDGFNCFADDAIGNLGVGDWRGREAIRDNLRKFIDTGFTAHHDVVEYWDGGHLKVFRGIVTMTPDNGKPVVHPVMTHFFYMDEANPTKVKHWYGAVGPVSFGA